MEQIVVSSSVSIKTIGILGLCIFGFLSTYLGISSSFIKSEMKKMEKAKEMIMRGHELAINGRKDDGYYEEIRKPREQKQELEDGQEGEDYEED